jgi:hypothetical protein
MLLKRSQAKLPPNASELSNIQIANLTPLKTLASTWAQSKIKIRNQLHQCQPPRRFRLQVYSLYIKSTMLSRQDQQTH